MPKSGAEVGQRSKFCATFLKTQPLPQAQGGWGSYCRKSQGLALTQHS